MTSYSEVKREIAKLQKKAAQIRNAAAKKVIAAIKKQIAEYGLTAADLGLGGRGRKAAPNGSRRAATKAPPKYMDPKTGKTWNGIGKPPLWIAGAKRREDFLIEGGEKAGKGRAPAKRATSATKKPAGTKSANTGAAKAKRSQKKGAAGQATRRSRPAKAPASPAPTLEAAAAVE